MTDLLTLYQIADTEQIRVDYIGLGKRDAISIMDEDGAKYIALDPKKLCSSQDEKMKIAHELGHCLTNSFYHSFSPYEVRQKSENRADKWAIKQLIPFEKLTDAIAGGYTDVWSLAEYFNVPEEFMRKAMGFYMYGNLAAQLYV